MIRGARQKLYIVIAKIQVISDQVFLFKALFGK